MARQPANLSVAQFRPRTEQLRDQIRALARDSRNVFWSRHAEDRMEERGITTLDALRVLSVGDIAGEIEPGQNVGEWKCKMIAGKRGARDIGVVTLVLRSGRLLIKTVEWEDL